MNDFLITSATNAEKTWAAELMATMEPWTTLGITLTQSLVACQEEGNLVYIARDDQKPVGVIILQNKGVAGSPYIKSIAVASGFRNQGAGKLLLTFAEDKYRTISKHLFLSVSSFNKQAQEFYKANGYRAVGEFENYIVDGHSEILMHKKLH